MGDLGSRIRAVELAAGIGIKIISEKPELANKIAECYETDYAADVAKKLEISKLFSLNDDIARAVIGFVIRGYKGSGKIKAYEGVIKNKEKIEELRKKHQSQRGKEAAEYNKSSSNTTFGLTPEQQKEHNKNIASYGGKRSFLMSAGIHSSKYKNKRRGFGIKGAIAIGNTPWVMRKMKTEHGDMNEPNYAYYSLTNLKKSISNIADEINQIFHKGKTIRNYSSIASMISKTKKEKHPELIKDVVPWKDEERVCLYEFLKIKYKYPDNKITDKEISKIINTKFHCSECVRTENSIYRQRRDFEEKYKNAESRIMLEREIRRIYERKSYIYKIDEFENNNHNGRSSDNLFKKRNNNHNNNHKYF